MENGPPSGSHMSDYFSEALVDFALQTEVK